MGLLFLINVLQLIGSFTFGLGIGVIISLLIQHDARK